MGFSRQECWSGLPFPSPGDLPDPGTDLSHKTDLLVEIILQTVVRINFKYDTNELIYKTETHSQTSKTNL